MSSPLIAGQVPDVISDKPRSVANPQQLPPLRNPSIAGSLTRKDSGLNKRVSIAQAGGAPAPIVRKKLPWLEGGQPSKVEQVPGAFESRKASLAPTDEPPKVATSTARAPGPVATSDCTEVSDSRRASIASLGPDPSLRAIGSTPSLRQRPKSGDFKTLSLNSDPRPGVKPAMSMAQAKQTLGAGNRKIPKDDDYTPSEYSTPISSDPDPIPARVLKNDPASYERLVQKAVTRKATAHEPAHIAQKWLQAQLEVSSDPVSPTAGPQGLRKSSTAYGAVRAGGPRDIRKASRPLDEAVLSAPIGRKSVALPIAPQAPPSPPPRTRTLHALPSHLMSPSSSSTDVPSHLMISSDTSSLSPILPPHDMPSMNVSPRATLRAPEPLAAKSRDLRRETRNLDRALTGLDHLMDEAVIVANEAAHSGRSDDVAHILNSASAALRKASTTFPSRHGRMSEPLQLSARESGDSSASDTDRSDGSSDHGRASLETAPTRFSKSAQSSRHPLVVDPLWLGDRMPGEKMPTERSDRRRRSSAGSSIARTPPRLYQPPSADSIVRDFAYAKLLNAKAQSARSLSMPTEYGAAADFYGDHGESVALQPGIRRSIAVEKMIDDPALEMPARSRRPTKETFTRTDRAVDNVPSGLPKSRRFTKSELRELEHRPTNTIPISQEWHNDRLRDDNTPPAPPPEPRQRKRNRYDPHVSDFFENS